MKKVKHANSSVDLIKKKSSQLMLKKNLLISSSKDLNMRSFSLIDNQILVIFI